MKGWERHARARCAALVALVLSPACARDPQPLRVLAAASLTEVVTALTRQSEGPPVALSFGSSSQLARQIRDGAPADVFISASRAWIDDLAAADALAGEPVRLARNQLVCIAPRGSALAERDVRDPGALLAALGDGDLVGIADAGAPAGEYARSALARLGLLGAFRGRLVGQKDVRAVLNAVERGELQAGFVYATDARVGEVERLFAFDPTTHPPIEVLAAVLRSSRRPVEARRLLEQLRSETGRAAFAAAGFAGP